MIGTTANERGFRGWLLCNKDEYVPLRVLLTRKRCKDAIVQRRGGLRSVKRVLGCVCVCVCVCHRAPHLINIVGRENSLG